MGKSCVTRLMTKADKPTSWVSLATRVVTIAPKNVGTLSVKGRSPEHLPEEKQTNEIKIAAPMQDVIEIDGRTNTSRYAAHTVRIGSISGGGTRCQLSPHGKKEPIKPARRSRFLFLLEHT
jgi:hypothetical protein